MNSAINETYGSLLIEARPHVIKDDEDNDRCIARLELLLSRDQLSPEEELVSLLSVLIEKLRTAFEIVPGATQADIVRHLVDANGCTVNNMEAALGKKSAVSIVLNGSRFLSMIQIDRLSDRFHVSPEVFFVKERAATD